MGEHDGLEIRSFRVVFEIERRLFRIDRWRLPLPYGLPVRGLVYALLALLLVLVAGRLPGMGTLLGVLPAPAKLVGLPAGAAWLLVRARVDGRAAHHHLRALVQYHVRARTFATLRPVRAPRRTCITGDVVIAPGPRGACYRRARIAGPASVELRAAARLRRTGRTLRVTPAPPGTAAGWVVDLDAGERLDIRGTRRSGGVG